MRLKTFLTVLTLLGAWSVQAQCNLSASSDTVSACTGDTVYITASGADTYLWSHDTTLSCQQCDSVFAIVTDTSTYILLQGNSTVIQPAVNGNFSSGNTGFLSNYTFNATSIWNEGTYAVGPNPNAVHPNFGSWGDHTTGSGNYMLVNGSTTANKILWRQIVALPPGVQVTMKWWMLTFVTPAGSLQLKLFGSNVGNPAYTPASSGVWGQASRTFTVPASGSATLNLITVGSAGAGNDFGIDDISFEYSCTEYDTIYIVPKQESQIALSSQESFFCDSTCMLIENYWDTLDVLDYQWVLNGPQSSDTVLGGAFVEWCAQDVGSYNGYVISTSLSGCTDSLALSPFEIGATRKIDSLNVSSLEGYWLNGTYVIDPNYPDLDWSVLLNQGQWGMDSLVLFAGNSPFHIEFVDSIPQWILGTTSAVPSGPSTMCAVLYTSRGCVDSVCLPIAFLPSAEIPNVFTPNEDGVNDLLEIQTTNADEVAFYVYNRWGKLVYSNSSSVVSWDGTSNGQPVAEGVYYYTAEVTNAYSLKPEVYSGSIHLFR